MIKTIIAALAIAVIVAGAVAITSNEEAHARSRFCSWMPLVVHSMGDYRVVYWSRNGTHYDQGTILPRVAIYFDALECQDRRAFYPSAQSI